MLGHIVQRSGHLLFIFVTLGHCLYCCLSWAWGNTSTLTLAAASVGTSTKEGKATKGTGCITLSGKMVAYYLFLLPWDIACPGLGVTKLLILLQQHQWGPVLRWGLCSGHIKLLVTRAEEAASFDRGNDGWHSTFIRSGCRVSSILSA